MKKIKFDDIVIEDNRKWTQVCRTCAEKVSMLGNLDPMPADGYMCGVKGCQNEALYYLDFNDKE